MSGTKQVVRISEEVFNGIVKPYAELKAIEIGDAVEKLIKTGKSRVDALDRYGLKGEKKPRAAKKAAEKKPRAKKAGKKKKGGKRSPKA